ncbi:hypothetical protein O181_017571 [Austropuccinia psidii MF-1]|uniref:Uncharacterized protein n=1 Tax=Austropuccinia psidii MF-1 TaxID=1389203 RepID=A0A9Q3C3M9_9BASI|nr:hypothetical protein [Austropuccinia psidii MF-1]
MCPKEQLILEIHSKDLDGEPIQEDQDKVINMNEALVKSMEESNRNNAKSQTLANKLISAYEKMSNHIDSVLVRMESMEKKMSTQYEKITALKDKKQVKDMPGFIKQFLKNNQLKNKTKEKKHMDPPSIITETSQKIYSQAVQTPNIIPHPQPNIPKSIKVNRFKLAYATLWSKIGASKPFENVSADSIQKRIN